MKPISIRALIILIPLLVMTPGAAGDKRQYDHAIAEGWNGLATHVSSVCNIHPFIYSFQTGLLGLVDETNRLEIEKIDATRTFSARAPISWIAADYAIHSILPIGFTKAHQAGFLKTVQSIRPIADPTRANHAREILSKIHTELSLTGESSKADSMYDLNVALSAAVYDIVQILDPFSRPEIRRDIDQYEDEMQDTCFAYEGLPPKNPIVECTENLLQLGGDRHELINKDMVLLKMLIHAARTQR